MLIKRAKFITSIVGDQPFPGQGLPEIAVAGKSNVGKSSLINSLCNNNRLARTSQEPGKTRVINVFLLNENESDAFHLMDLPGYGYARVAKGMQADWGRMMNAYLMGSQHICHILHLVDIRHEPGAHDKQMAAWIRATGIPCTVVATKADKLSRAQRQSALHLLGRNLAAQPWELLSYSSVTKEGKDALLDRLGAALEAEPTEP